MARIEEKIKKGQTERSRGPARESRARPRSAKVIDLAEL
jgi:hypothetical protein